MACEFPTTAPSIHTKKHDLEKLDLVVLKYGQEFNLFSDRFELIDKDKNINNIRDRLICGEVLEATNFEIIKYKPFEYICIDPVDGEDLLYISSYFENKYMVEFYGSDNEQQLLKSIDDYISEGICFKNLNIFRAIKLGDQCFNQNGNLRFCRVESISDIEKYVHNFNGRSYKIAVIYYHTYKY